MGVRLGWPSWIGVVADDLGAQAAFYRDTLGFREEARGDGWVEFDVDGHLFEVIERSSLLQYEQRRFQVGFEVDDIESARQALIGAGVEPISGIEGGDDTANRWCYFRDPEGNVFEITQWLRPRGRPGE
jgi:catechol 2,3-dioxygenase-like lactoylglutathione lyase family enzyme